MYHKCAGTEVEMESLLDDCDAPPRKKSKNDAENEMITPKRRKKLLKRKQKVKLNETNFSNHLLQCIKLLYPSLVRYKEARQYY